MNANPKIKIIFDRHKKASFFVKGTVEVEIYFHKKRNRIALPISLLKSQWRGGIVVNHPNADRLNMFIQDICMDLVEKIHQMGRDGQFNLNILVDLVKKKRFASNTTFLDFMEQRINLSRKRQNYLVAVNN